jgi:hypothetical protein
VLYLHAADPEMETSNYEKAEETDTIMKRK